MSKFGFIAIALFTLVLILTSVWRERRSERWNRMGKCYQCGFPLGFGSTAVALRFKASPARKVDFCGRCAKHRLVWGWLVAALIVAFAGVVWWGLQNS
jgi:hypothetical protein